MTAVKWVVSRMEELEHVRTCVHVLGRHVSAAVSHSEPSFVATA